jgi:hypothetical protein
VRINTLLLLALSHRRFAFLFHLREQGSGLLEHRDLGGRGALLLPWRIPERELHGLSRGFSNMLWREDPALGWVGRLRGLPQWRRRWKRVRNWTIELLTLHNDLTVFPLRAP